MARDEALVMDAPLHLESSSSSLLDLHNRLDSLWTAYLRYLDEYTEAQKLVQKHMSAGFLSLARANFNARDGIRRFGKDFYHERAVASGRVQISSAPEYDHPRVSVIEWFDEDLDSKSSDSGIEEKTESTEVEQHQQPSPPPTPTSKSDDNSDDEKTSEKMDAGDSRSEHAETNKKPALPLDPIRWFGILVPPELRSAQTSFACAANDPFATAVNAARAMRELEFEIRRHRKEIRKAEKAGK